MMKEKLLVLVLTVLSQCALAGGITVEDRLAINETIASYGHNFDRRNGEGFAALFEPDGRWDAFPNKSPKALISLQGRKNIAAFANDRQRMFADAGVETKHFMLDIVITEQSEDEVHCSAMAIILWQRPLDGDPLPRPVQTGYYDYVLRKSDEGWKFHQVNVLTSGFYKPEEIYGEIKQ
jgi:hypothetical protein